MGKSQEDLVKWSLKKSEEYLSSAQKNLEEGRLYPAAEEIFRAVETSLEAMLYKTGVREITYPGRKKKFTGRLALQFLIRDNLFRAGRIDKKVYDQYLAMASDLHQKGYEFGEKFTEKELRKDLEFAEFLFYKAKSK